MVEKDVGETGVFDSSQNELSANLSGDVPAYGTFRSPLLYDSHEETGVPFDRLVCVTVEIVRVVSHLQDEYP